MMLLWLTALCLAGVSAQFDCEPGWSGRGPLYDYVFCEDPHYGWEVVEVYPQEGVTTYILNMTSQQWYDEELHSWPIWWHFLAVSVPDEIVHPGHGFLYISTGSNTDNIPDLGTRHVGETRDYALNTGMVAAALRQIPNQPITFAYNHNNLNITRDRREDSIIAWTWREFFEDTTDPNILLRWPMCKATSRAMDAMTEFTAQLNGNDVQEFMVTGESKRGWTAWLHGAIDDRVIAMAPVVLSCVNVQETMKHYYTSLGGWPLAFGDYYLENVTSYMDSPQARELELMVDPLEYIDYLHKPKLMVSGAKDEFFFIDDYWYWYDDMPEPKNMWILENTGHSINQSPIKDEYYRMLETFFLTVITGFEIPAFSWTREETETSGSLTLYSPVTPINITAWSADTPEAVFPRRDFRSYAGIPPRETNITWYPKPVEDLGDGYFYVEYEMPEPGEPESYAPDAPYDDPIIPPRIDECTSSFRAFYMKIYYEGPDGRPLIFSTEPQIIPDCMPFETCYGTACQGILR